MRWSQAVKVFSACALSMTLVSCKKESSSSSSKNTAVKRAARVNTDDVKTNPASASTPPATTTSQANSAELCYQELCASKNELSYPKMITAASNPSAEQKSYYEINFKPVLEQALEARNTSIELLINSAEKHQFTDVNLSEQQLRLIKAVLLIHSSKELPAEVQETYLKSIAQSEIFKAHQRSRIKGPEGYFETLYPSAPTIDAVKKEAQNIFELQDKVNSALGAKLINLKNGPIARVLKNEAMDSADLKRVMNNSFSLRMLELLIFTESKITDEVPLDLLKIKEMFPSEQLLANLKEQEQKSKSPNIQSLCEANFYRTLNLYPTKEEVNSFKATTEQIRGEVLKTLTSQDPAFAVIQKAPIYMPEDNTTMASQWLTTLKDSIKESQEEQNLYSTLSKETLFTLSVLFKLTPSNPGRICEDIGDFAISDITSTLDNGIKLSWLSVKAPFVGVSIVAHELGHLVSKHSTAFSNQKACLAERQSPLYVEEDFADIIASKVSQKMQNSLNAKQGNMGCFFASMNEKQSLKNSDDKDPHSSNLFRAIQIAQLRKEEIPESCKGAAHQEQSNALKVCE